MIQWVLALVATAIAAPTYEAVYQGVYGKGQACELRVIKTYYEANTGKWEDLRAEVNTDFGHGSDVPGDVILKPDATDDKKVAGTNSEDTTIEVSLGKGQVFDSLIAYSLKWKHGDHFHTYLCKKLQLVKTP